MHPAAEQCQHMQSKEYEKEYQPAVGFDPEDEERKVQCGKEDSPPEQHHGEKRSSPDHEWASDRR